MGKSIRSLIKSAPYSLAVILTLTLGIGATGSLFTVINSVLLKPLPYGNASELVLLSGVQQDASGKLNEYTTSASNVQDWRERSRAFRSIAALQADEIAMTGDREPRQIDIGRVTANLLDTLGVVPHKGRFFRSDEDAGLHSVAVLSHSLWADSFGSSEDLHSLRLLLDNVSYEIIGVAPPDFFFAAPVQAWIPLDMSVPRTPRNPNGFLQAVGRVMPGVSLQSANDDIRRVATEMSAEFPDSHTGWGAKAHDIRFTYTQSVRPVLRVLMIGVLLLLLISCANVANLVLARAIERQKEFAIQVALGATQKQLFLQMFAEYFLLTFTSGALAVLVTMLSIRPILMFSPLAVSVGRSFRIANSMSLDWRSLSVILTLSVVIGAILSVLPVFRFKRVNLAEALQLEGRHATGSRKHKRLRDLIVASQVALACILLTAAGWIVQRFWSLNRIDPGFEISERLAFRIVLPATRYDTHEKRSLFLQQSLQQLNTVPGVRAVGASTRMPLNEFAFTTLFNIEGRAPVNPGEALVSNFRRISSGFFMTAGISILKGREFENADGPNSMPVAIVSREFERRYWPGESAIGKRIVRKSRTDSAPRTIVGVVEDVKDITLWSDAQPTLYMPYLQGSIPSLYFVVHTVSSPSATKPMIQSAIRSIDSNLPITELKTMNERYADSLSRPRFAAYMISIFAIAGILLAAVGVYGTVSYSIHQRRQEIGIRIAMGSQPGQIWRFLLAQGFPVAVLGLLSGSCGILLLAQLTTSLDYATGSSNLLPAFLASVVLNLLIWGIASSLPAARAAKIDPMRVLK